MDRSPPAIDGVDGMTVDDLPLFLKDHWPPAPWQRAAMGTPGTIRRQLLDGTYRPQPVLRVEIPKAGGGTRALGIPPCGVVGTPQPHGPATPRGARPSGPPRSRLRGVAASSSRRCCPARPSGRARFAGRIDGQLVMDGASGSLGPDVFGSCGAWAYAGYGKAVGLSPTASRRRRGCGRRAWRHRGRHRRGRTSRRGARPAASRRDRSKG